MSITETATAQPTEAIQAVRVDLAAVHRLLAREGLHEGTWSHLSARIPGHPDKVALTPGLRHWSLVRASDVLVVGPDGAVVLGEGRPNPSAWAIHGPIYAARPDIGCILHTHMPHATALTLRAEFRFEERADQHSASFYGKVAYFQEYDGVVVDQSEGEAMARALGAKQVLFLRNHGVLLVERTPGMGFTRLYTLERACLFQVLARTGGHELAPMSDAAAARVAAYDDPEVSENFTAMKEVLDAREPDYAL
jgi:ribulose-5-phosphate 4-epimerase/fuculose-1-phosphate aldolase